MRFQKIGSGEGAGMRVVGGVEVLREAGGIGGMVEEMVGIRKQVGCGFVAEGAACSVTV